MISSSMLPIDSKDVYVLTGKIDVTVLQYLYWKDDLGNYALTFIPDPETRLLLEDAETRFEMYLEKKLDENQGLSTPIHFCPASVDERHFTLLSTNPLAVEGNGTWVQAEVYISHRRATNPITNMTGMMQVLIPNRILLMENPLFIPIQNRKSKWRLVGFGADSARDSGKDSTDIQPKKVKLRSRSTQTLKEKKKDRAVQVKDDRDRRSYISRGSSTSTKATSTETVGSGRGKRSLPIQTNPKGAPRNKSQRKQQGIQTGICVGCPKDTTSVTSASAIDSVACGSPQIRSKDIAGRKKQLLLVGEIQGTNFASKSVG